MLGSVSFDGWITIINDQDLSTRRSTLGESTQLVEQSQEDRLLCVARMILCRGSQACLQQLHGATTSSARDPSLFTSY